jgi:uncharacterized protein YkwD
MAGWGAMRTPSLAAALLTPVLALTLALPAAVSVAAQASNAQASNAPERAGKVHPRAHAWEAKVVALTNARRAAHGVKPLRAAACPDDFAEPWARHMAKTHQLVHHPSLSPLLDRCHASSAGENIAVGYETPRAVVRAWMSDKGHRDNLLNPHFHRIGVAAVRTDGVTFSIQDFVG